MIDWVEVPAGRFALGDDPARLHPPEPDETPRRVVSLAAFRIPRLPLTGADGRPVTSTGSTSGPVS